MRMPFAHLVEEVSRLTLVDGVDPATTLGQLRERINEDRSELYEEVSMERLLDAVATLKMMEAFGRDLTPRFFVAQGGIGDLEAFSTERDRDDAQGLIERGAD